MHLTFEQVCTSVGTAVAGVSGAWTIRSWIAKKREERAKQRLTGEEAAALEARWKAEVLSSLDAHETLLNMHETRLNLMDHK